MFTEEYYFTTETYNQTAEFIITQDGRLLEYGIRESQCKKERIKGMRGASDELSQEGKLEEVDQVECVRAGMQSAGQRITAKR